MPVLVRAKVWQGHSGWSKTTRLQQRGQPESELSLSRARVWTARLYSTTQGQAWAVGCEQAVISARSSTNLGDHADDEAFLLDVVRLYGIAILEDLAYLGQYAQ